MDAEEANRLFRRFTVPWPRSRVEDGVLTRTCPACGRDFREVTDAMGEMVTNRYAAHYNAAHRGDL